MLYLNNIYCFKVITHIKQQRLKMMDETYNLYNDLNLIHKYKMFFPKENYNNLIQDILNNKVTKIYI